MPTMNLGLLFVIGIAVFSGVVGARLFQKLHVPQVVGYIIVGVILGQTGFDIVAAHDLQTLEPFNFFALGVIGFLVGSELNLDIFKKTGKQYFTILLCEGFAVFILVTFAAALILIVITRHIGLSVAGGMLFGAIAVATDPASTMNVLWEYRSKGPLTTGLTAVMVMDNALAIILYGLGAGLAGALAGGGSFVTELSNMLLTFGGAIALGFVCGQGLRWFLRWFPDPERNLALALGIMLLMISIAVYFKLNVIFTAMILGATLINTATRRSKPLMNLLKGFVTPIYALFFVLVGASVTFKNVPWWLWALVIIYVVGRSLGKYYGSRRGAILSGSPQTVQKYLGLGLMSQGGMAIGLSIMAAQNLGHIMVTDSFSLAQVIVFSVTTTTFIVQLAGPLMAKAAVKKAGEIGRNITEADLAKELKVKDVMRAEVLDFYSYYPLTMVMPRVLQSQSMIFPVIDVHGRLEGMISVSSLKKVMLDQDAWEWLLVDDVMYKTAEIVTVTEDMALDQALHKLETAYLDHVVVTDSAGAKPVGILELTGAGMAVAKIFIERQKPAE